MPSIPIQASSLPELLAAIKATTQGSTQQPATIYERGWSKSRFIRENLPTLMGNRGYFGRCPKRIRKKKIKAFLRKAIWGHLGKIMAEPIARRVDYASIGRQAFVVTPL